MQSLSWNGGRPRRFETAISSFIDSFIPTDVTTSEDGQTTRRSSSRCSSSSHPDLSTNVLVTMSAVKKQKTEDTTTQAAEEAWEHYRNYLDSVANEESSSVDDGVGDVDELVELLTLAKPHVSPVQSPTSTKLLPTKGVDKDGLVAELVQRYRSTKALLPVLCSVARYHLADVAIDETVDQQEQQDNDQQDPWHHVQSSLQYFDWNAKCWSVGANYGRMTQTMSPPTVCAWYQQAATCASIVRTAALQLLEGPDAVQDDMVKEWIELLFLDSIADAEYVVTESDDNDEASSATNEAQQQSRETSNQDPQQKDDEEETGYFSASNVEAISRFMSSMLLSTAGRHQQALQQLQQFDLTHRLHPNIWNGVTAKDDNNCTTCTNGSIGKDPVVYPNEALPGHLYKRLCQVFAPDSKYWIESDYAHRGYFSYFMDVPSTSKESAKPTNLMEEVIFEHLLPLAKRTMKQEQDIVGAEWWVHTRPIQANLGHNLHFDTDEALLAQQGKIITHPVLSSVLYLTGNDKSQDNSCPSGPTIVLNQTPDSEENAAFCWACTPRDNSFMVFPGNLLHGVLPCPGDDSENDMNNENVQTVEWERLVTNKENSRNMSPRHRLTFMVGFWTRRVPEKMKERRLYGPCGPLPPATSDHTWVMDISKGYNNSKTRDTGPTHWEQLEESITLPRIYPAWEEITRSGKSINHDDIDNPRLQLPSGAQRIDHRFFVKDPPNCFRDSLFE